MTDDQNRFSAMPHNEQPRHCPHALPSSLTISGVRHRAASRRRSSVRLNCVTTTPYTGRSSRVARALAPPARRRNRRVGVIRRPSSRRANQVYVIEPYGVEPLWVEPLLESSSYWVEPATESSPPESGHHSIRVCVAQTTSSDAATQLYVLFFVDVMNVEIRWVWPGRRCKPECAVLTMKKYLLTQLLPSSFSSLDSPAARSPGIGS